MVKSIRTTLAVLLAFLISGGHIVQSQTQTPPEPPAWEDGEQDFDDAIDRIGGYGGQAASSHAQCANNEYDIAFVAGTSAGLLVTTGAGRSRGLAGGVCTALGAGASLAVYVGMYHNRRAATIGALTEEVIAWAQIIKDL